MSALAARPPERVQAARQRDLERAIDYLRDRQDDRMHGKVILTFRDGRIVAVNLERSEPWIDAADAT